MAAGDFRQLQLEVFLNGAATHLIGSFTLLASGRVAAPRSELQEMGLKPSGESSPQDLVVLADVPGLSYHYDEPLQRIEITASDEARVTKNNDVTTRPNGPHPMQTDYGAVLNYTLFAASAGYVDPVRVAFSGASATLDARTFTPFGTLNQSAILRTALGDQFDALRLDTAFAYSDPRR